MTDERGTPNGKWVLAALAFLTKLNVRMEESFDRGDPRAVRAEILEQMFAELEAHEMVVLDMCFDFLTSATGWIKTMIPYKIRMRWPEDEFKTNTAVISSDEKLAETVAQLRERGTSERHLQVGPDHGEFLPVREHSDYT